MEWQNEEFALAGVNHLALVTSDMKRTVEFYTEVLGMRLVKTIELSGGRTIRSAPVPRVRLAVSFTMP